MDSPSKIKQLKKELRLDFETLRAIHIAQQQLDSLAQQYQKTDNTYLKTPRRIL